MFKFESKCPVWLEAVITVSVAVIALTSMFHLDFPPMVVVLKVCLVFFLCETLVYFFTKIKDYRVRALAALIMTLAVSPLF